MAGVPDGGPLESMQEDPNGPPNQAAVPVKDSAAYQRAVGEPTAGQMGYIPPFFKSPHFDPLQEGYGTPGPNM